LAIVPLRGTRQWAGGEIRDWRQDLPADVANHCRDWVRWLAQYPLDVKESARYDAASDTTTLTEEFSCQSLDREAGGPFVPVLPPALVAQRGGLDIAFSSPPIDTCVATLWGPYKLIHGTAYQIRLKGLGKYASEVRTLGGKKLLFGKGEFSCRCVTLAQPHGAVF
jgi:hypothetical protein